MVAIAGSHRCFCSSDPQIEIAFIASQAEFTPRNVQTREERVKLVYAVKVRITQDSTYDLKPGIPADVALATQP